MLEHPDSVSPGVSRLAARQPFAGLVFRQLSRGGSHSRFHNCLRHIAGKAIQTLKPRQALDGISIFYPCAKEPAKHVYLLPGKIGRWEGSNDGREVGDCSRSDLPVFIIDILAQGLHNLYEGCVSSLEFCSALASTEFECIGGTDSVLSGLLFAQPPLCYSLRREHNLACLRGP